MIEWLKLALYVFTAAFVLVGCTKNERSFAGDQCGLRDLGGILGNPDGFAHTRILFDSHYSQSLGISSERKSECRDNDGSRSRNGGFMTVEQIHKPVPACNDVTPSCREETHRRYPRGGTFILLALIFLVVIILIVK